MKLGEKTFVNQIEEEKLSKIFSIFIIEKQKFNTWQAIKQAEENSVDENRIPMVVFRRNNSKTYCVVEFERLMELLYQQNLKKQIEKPIPPESLIVVTEGEK